jgi:hypothetical protein
MDSEGHAARRRSEHRDLALRLEILNGVLNTLTDVLDIKCLRLFSEFCLMT